MKFNLAPLFFAVLFILTTLPVSAANRDWEQGDFYSVRIDSFEAVARMKMLGVRSRDRLGDSIVVRITEEQKRLLLQNGFELESLPGNPAIGGGRSVDSCSAFSQHDDVVRFLDALADDYPEIVQRITLGYSVENREIPAVIISSNPGVEEDEPEVRVLGAHHGDECMSVEISLEIADYLTRNYGQIGFESITELVDGLEIMVAPLINPDGNDSSDGYSSRYNANGTDLNRDYGYQWRNDSYEGKPFAEPEVRAVVDDALLNNYVLSYSFHTVADYINYPWNMGYSSGTYFAAADDDELKYVSNVYSVKSGATPINGCDWYMTNGDTNDWSYGSRGNLDITIETADYNVALVAPKNRNGVLETFKLLKRGIRGVVTDAETGEPIEAMLLFDNPKWQIYSDPYVGDYHKFLLPGTYSYTVWAPGYAAARVQNVTVTAGDGSMVRRDVQLTRNGRYYAFQVIGVISALSSSGNSWPYQAFGPPDGSGFALKKVDEFMFSTEGEIVLDMNVQLENLEGPDLKIYEAGNKPGRSYKVYVAMSYNPESWTYLGRGTGDSVFELGAAAREYLAFVRIKDDNANSSFVLDAVEYAPLPEDGDSDGDTDNDVAESDNDADIDYDMDQIDGDALEVDDSPDGDDDTDDAQNDCLTQGDLHCWSILLQDDNSCRMTEFLSHPRITGACNTVSLPVFELCDRDSFSLLLEKRGDEWYGTQDCMIVPSAEGDSFAFVGDCGLVSESIEVSLEAADCGALSTGKAEIVAEDCSVCEADGDVSIDGDDENSDSEDESIDGDESESPDGDIAADGDASENSGEWEGGASDGCASSTAAWPPSLILLALGLLAFKRRFCP